MHWFKSAITQKPLKWRQPNFVWYERTCMANMKPNLGFLELVDWELCLLEVGRFYGWLLAILTTVQWCQVAHRNTRYVPSRYTHHILPHIGHWWPFGNNWWSTISSPSFRSFLGVDLTHLIKPSVHCYQVCFELLLGGGCALADSCLVHVCSFIQILSKHILNIQKSLEY